MLIITKHQLTQSFPLYVCFLRFEARLKYTFLDLIFPFLVAGCVLFLHLFPELFWFYPTSIHCLGNYSDHGTISWVQRIIFDLNKIQPKSWTVAKTTNLAWNPFPMVFSIQLVPLSSCPWGGPGMYSSGLRVWC